MLHIFSQIDDLDEIHLADVFVADVQAGAVVVASAPQEGEGNYRTSAAALAFPDSPPVTGLELTLTERVGAGRPQVEGNAPQPLPSFLADWRAKYQHLRALRPGTTRTRPLGTTRQVDVTGLNLPEMLLELSTDPDPTSWNRIKAVMGSLIPDAGEIFARPSGTEMSVLFREPGASGTRNLKDLGTGVEQLLLTTLAGLEAPAGAVVAIEEPETNLHPGAQRELLQRLREWSEDRLFVVATHSSVFLDAGAESLNVWLVERGNRGSTVRQVETEALSEALGALGVRASDILSADRLLVTEGDGDAGIIRGWFPAHLQRLTIVPGLRGGDLAWQMTSLADILDTANRLATGILFLRDRDELSDDQVKELQAAEVVRVLDRRELENYLLDPDAINKAIRERKEAAGLETEDEAVSLKTIRQIADELKPIVVLKRVANNIKPLRLVSRSDIRSISVDSASKDLLLNHVRSKLPEADLLEVIAAAWDKEEEVVEAAWDEHWIELAPGADILERLYKARGLSYNKRTDGPRIAAHVEPPREIIDVLKAFAVEEQLEAKQIS